ncbi:DUF91 domain-containing protein [Candidatus Bathyarchaeota archaeon]|nr:MAG: DUF91 domain-containing protein [Candidatus Bathyarchaeota archaeon]
MSIEKISVESKQELEQMITKEMNQIEKGLTVVCSHVQVNSKTELDILCHDDNGQLVIVQLNANEDDNILLHGIQSLDYVNKFKSFLKATYNKHRINDKENPRLILIAPNFSETLHHAVEHMQGIRIDLYEWEYLKLGDHKGLRLQPIFTWKPTEKPKEEKKETKPEKKKEKAPEKKEEPEPEPPKEEFPKFPLPTEKSEEKEPEKKKEQPRRKLKLF